MNECIISIGSNKNREANIELASEKLKDYFYHIVFSDILATDPIETPPETNQYLNLFAIAYTDKNAEDIIRFFKETELFMGRLPSDKISHSVSIDIDLLQWNKQILKSRDFDRKYVKEGLRNLSRKLKPEISDVSILGTHLL